MPASTSNKRRLHTSAVEVDTPPTPTVDTWAPPMDRTSMLVAPAVRSIAPPQRGKDPVSAKINTAPFTVLERPAPRARPLYCVGMRGLGGFGRSTGFTGFAFLKGGPLEGGVVVLVPPA